MCRALRVLCAAPSVERLVELKLAAVSAAWELVGGAASSAQVATQVAEWQPDVAVLDAGLGPGVVGAAREARPNLRLVSVGPLEGVDVQADGLDGLRQAIAVTQKPGGPVGG